MSPVKKVKAERPTTISEQEKQLEEEGYQTFTYEQGDSTYLMQQYYLVFLKQGKNRSQDSLEAAKLQEQHLAHLSRMAEEGFVSLAGPFGDDGEIRGIVVFNTPTQKEADSLARLDPTVEAGRLEVGSASLVDSERRKVAVEDNNTFFWRQGEGLGVLAIWQAVVSVCECCRFK